MLRFNRFNPQQAIFLLIIASAMAAIVGCGSGSTTSNPAKSSTGEVEGRTADPDTVVGDAILTSTENGAVLPPGPHERELTRTSSALHLLGLVNAILPKAELGQLPCSSERLTIFMDIRGNQS